MSHPHLCPSCSICCRCDDASCEPLDEYGFGPDRFCERCLLWFVLGGADDSREAGW